MKMQTYFQSKHKVSSLSLNNPLKLNNNIVLRKKDTLYKNQNNSVQIKCSNMDQFNKD